MVNRVAAPVKILNNVEYKGNMKRKYEVDEVIIESTRVETKASTLFVEAIEAVILVVLVAVLIFFV